MIVATAMAALSPAASALAARLPAGSKLTAPYRCTYMPGMTVDGAKYKFGGTDSYGYYHVASTPDLPGGHWEIHGQYPKANVLAFQSINAGFLTQGVLSAKDVAADPGSLNPYAPGNPYRPGDTFTFRVEFAKPSEREQPNPPGVLYAGYRMADGPHGTPPRSLGGTGVLESIGGGVPTNTGGVPRPKASWVVDDPGRNRIQNTLQLCAAMYVNAQPLQVGASLLLDPVEATVGPQTAILKRIFVPSPLDPYSGVNGTPFVNAFRPSPKGYDWPFSQSSHYLYTMPNPRYGKFYVIRFKKPRTSHVAQGIPNNGQEQVAYYDWCGLQIISFLINTVGKCLDGDELEADSQGYATIVVSPENQRPVIDGEPYSDWLVNPAAGGMVWMYALDSNRDTWPQSPYFAPQSLSRSTTTPYLTDWIQESKIGDKLKQHMGEYYPQVYYCTKQKFEAGQCKPPSGG